MVGRFRCLVALRFDESRDRSVEVQRIEEPIDLLVQHFNHRGFRQVHICRVPLKRGRTGHHRAKGTAAVGPRTARRSLHSPGAVAALHSAPQRDTCLGRRRALVCFLSPVLTRLLFRVDTLLALALKLPAALTRAHLDLLTRPGSQCPVAARDVRHTATRTRKSCLARMVARRPDR